jgi:hypothetical protein
MAGKRMIHSNICESKKLSTVSYAAEALYYRLLSRVDDDGNFTAEPRIILGQCLPYRTDQDAESVEELLQELATITVGEKQPLISFYFVESDRYLHINRFQDFQYLRPDRTAVATYPTHPQILEKSTLAERKDNGLPVVYQRSTEGVPTVSPNQINVKSNQIKTNAFDSGNFKNIAVRYRRIFHVSLSHGNIQKDEYAKACQEFSEDVVLAQFDKWAPDNMWIKERRHTSGLRQFYESLSASIEAERLMKSDEEDTIATRETILNLEIAAVKFGQIAHEAEELELAARRQEEEEIAARVAVNPDAAYFGGS